MDCLCVSARQDTGTFSQYKDIMKVNAHPMLVAVALGILGPAALAADDSRSARTTCDRTKSVDETDLVVASLEDSTDDPYWTRLELQEDDGMPSISPSDWEASEAAWEQARLTL